MKKNVLLKEWMNKKIDSRTCYGDGKVEELSHLISGMRDVMEDLVGSLPLEVKRKLYAKWRRYG